ncbi:hypothetical protein DMENIID0001_146970 [Sergentomyia squamirostris]
MDGRRKKPEGSVITPSSCLVCDLTQFSPIGVLARFACDFGTSCCQHKRATQRKSVVSEPFTSEDAIGLSALHCFLTKVIASHQDIVFCVNW